MRSYLLDRSPASPRCRGWIGEVESFSARISSLRLCRTPFFQVVGAWIVGSAGKGSSGAIIHCGDSKCTGVNFGGESYDDLVSNRWWPVNGSGFWDGFWRARSLQLPHCPPSSIWAGSSRQIFGKSALGHEQMDAREIIKGPPSSEFRARVREDFGDADFGRGASKVEAR